MSRPSRSDDHGIDSAANEDDLLPRQPKSHGVDCVLVAALGFEIITRVLSHGGFGGTSAGIGSRGVGSERQLIAVPRLGKGPWAGQQTLAENLDEQVTIDGAEPAGRRRGDNVQIKGMYDTTYSGPSNIVIDFGFVLPPKK